MSDLVVDELVQEFLVESYENLDNLDRQFIVLETEPNEEIIASIFRTVHTLKGSSGFLGLNRLEALTHVGENLLSRLRDKKLELTEEITSALLAMVDAVRVMLGHLETVGNDGTDDHAEMIAGLARLAGEGDGATHADPAGSAPTGDTGGNAASDDVRDGDEGGAPVPTGDTHEAAGVGPAGPAPTAAGGDEAAVASVASGAPTSGAGSAADTTIRVDVGLLDKLMNLVGELVLARNQILQVSAVVAEASFLGTSQRLNHITTELQEGVMKTRMQPIGNIWNKFPRIVRDLAGTCHKHVRVEMEGAETELDKTIIEAVKDPLTHLVRNAVDHGVELPEVREACGKPAEGRLHLRAYHEGGQVNIEISDDGGGIDVARIREKALSRGTVTPDQVTRMSDREILDLIFLPGFSTAETVSNLSGRGVGMDVVRTNIEKIGGSIDINTTLGQGTTFRIKIPLTLAIIPALMVKTAGDSYAIPQVNLLELVRIEEGHAAASISEIHGALVYRLRGELLPLLYLQQELQVAPADEVAAGQGDVSDTAVSHHDGALNIVILQADNRAFGLVVDDILDTEEIVVKPLGKLLKHISSFAGATIMGDGRVGLILDVLGVAGNAGLGTSREPKNGSGAVRQESEANRGQRLLLVGTGTGESERIAAMPLSSVNRLEEIPLSSMEQSGNQKVVQYRETIMPIVWLADLFPNAATSESETAAVVVLSIDGHTIGVAVDRIIDVIEERIVVQQVSNTAGITGSAVVQGRVTEILDLTAVLSALAPSLLANLSRDKASIGS